MQTDAVSDDELVEKVGRGDRQAASVLVRRHSQRVLNISRRMLGNEAEAEDVTQDVFLKVWKSAVRWVPGEAKFTTWLHRVTMNACLDKLRKPRMGNMDVVPETVDEAATPAEELETKSRSNMLKIAMQDLPERQRAALALCYFEDVSNIEAAGILEVSVDALESLLARGRRALKQALMANKDELLVANPQGRASGFEQ
ncbi:RNA polymerase sigma factor [Hirschia litorea]|uniref:RNA polymerase sigma factor n=1 Tax=Hirschia litorea TaxID=1199156 RepID=A0ABW2IJ29_9PROT